MIYENKTWNPKCYDTRAFTTISTVHDVTWHDIMHLWALSGVPLWFVSAVAASWKQQVRNMQVVAWLKGSAAYRDHTS